MSVVKVKEEPGLPTGPSDESADASQNRRKGSRRQGGGILSSAGMPGACAQHAGFTIVLKTARVSDDLRGRVRDLVKSLMDCFIGSQWLDVAGLVCAMKRNKIRPDALPSIWRDYHKLTHTPPHHMSLFLESFRDIFESRTIYSAPVISRLVQAGVLATPFGRIPNPPLLLYRLRPVAGKDPSGYLMTHPLNTWTSSRVGAAFVLPALPSTCSYCRPNGVWVGHSELAHSRAGDSSVSVEPQLQGGVPADAELLRVRRKRHDEWAALEEVRRKKLEEVELRQRGVRVTGALRPWQAGDYVVVRGADVPTANLCFVIGRDGFMIEAVCVGERVAWGNSFFFSFLFCVFFFFFPTHTRARTQPQPPLLFTQLQDKLQVLLKVPYRGEREGDIARIMVRGLPERVSVAVEYIEARFGDSMESVATKHNLWRKLERKYVLYLCFNKQQRRRSFFYCFFEIYHPPPPTSFHPPPPCIILQGDFFLFSISMLFSLS